MSGTHPPAAWHLVAGSTGAGKTTYARALATQLGGVCFSIDNWMNTLFWPDCPEKNDFAWATERVRRCELQAAAVAADLIRLGISSVLDMGLTTQPQREGWRLLAQAAEIPVELHSLELPAELRWHRVQERNRAADGTFVFPVTPEILDGMEQMWEPPTVKEAAKYRALHRDRRIG